MRFEKKVQWIFEDEDKALELAKYSFYVFLFFTFVRGVFTTIDIIIKGEQSFVLIIFLMPLGVCLMTLLISLMGWKRKVYWERVK